jgi:hypothetical protein
MQANKDQDWADDAAFWDDAWADMNSRLDKKPERRKGILAWWPFYLCAGAALVLVAVGARTISGQGEIEASPPLPSVEVPASSPIAASEDSKLIAEIPSLAGTNEGKPVLSVSAKNIPQQSDQPRTTVASTQPAATPPPVANTQRTVAPLTTELTASHGATSPNISSPATPSANDGSEEKAMAVVKAFIPRETSCGNIFPGITIDLLKQTFITEGIPPLEIDQLFVDELNSVPNVPLQRHKYPNPLTLEAGLTSDFTFGYRGGYAGIGYRVTGGKKLSFPLSLRYRLDQLEIKDSPLEDPDENGLGTGSAPTEGTADLLLIPQSISATALELGAGVAWDATPRLRLSTGLSASYQVLALVNFEGQGNRGIFNQADFAVSEDYSVRLNRGEALLSTLTIDGASPDFTPWNFRANFGATYDITPRLGVNLKATRLLTQPDRADILGLRTGRMEIGLSYRLR